KTKVSDPPVGGDYTYAYDNFGQLLQEINPKGKTDYAYDQFGRLAKKIFPVTIQILKLHILMMLMDFSLLKQDPLTE
ncbi:RHS repeat domain-containing protein, partial [Chryseobacterium sp. CH1]|uniref:RHS repeat domain-containing protein n=1 Tax=Chryseobacterium sp. CH1 TaxID=713551 RepID=UPI001025AF2A